MNVPLRVLYNVASGEARFHYDQLLDRSRDRFSIYEAYDTPNWDGYGAKTEDIAHSDVVTFGAPSDDDLDAVRDHLLRTLRVSRPMHLDLLVTSCGARTIQIRVAPKPTVATSR